MLESTDDDLSAAIEQLFSSGAPLLEPLGPLICCCGQDECLNHKAWQAKKLQLENQLHLSAELGAALLQRHEAHISRHKNCSLESNQNGDIHIFGSPQETDSVEDDFSQDNSGQNKDNHISELLKENDALTKELNELTINKEAMELSLATTQQQLQGAYTQISHLSILKAKYDALQKRLLVVQRERDDMEQERDIQSIKASVAQQKLTKSKAKADTLSSELRQLGDELKQKNHLHKEATESLVQVAKTQMQTLNTELRLTPVSENAEYTNILQSMSQNEEDLQQENMELRTFLSEARDELHALQQEVEEQQIHLPIQ
ncbi:hypothetical protein GGU10DRAFT_378732 [Lentinula aff. detonsa]|uniref:Uncharacterized protein n=1 Tax=Lentinula aff. detonsa TaxID=2804958 RepID=A0AA38NBX8_9AGAR|nr:hypothetical protein GGU10DRAFT_378732 [Lentinula aff. detonsa]